jgi:hypothetical protein
MVCVNLAVVNMTWSKALNRSILELWEVWDREELIKKEEFEYGTSFCLGCFKIHIDDRLIDNYDEFIDKVVLKYKKCHLTIEFYKKEKLIERIEVNDYIITEKGNVWLWASKF